jgi:hypothetical protein
MHQALTAAIEQVCPINGVSIGRRDDKSTWRIDYRAAANDQQKAAALAVVEAFDQLAVFKAELKLRVDEDAERNRMRYITPGTGMAMTYAEKRDQAHAVHSMGQAAANALSEAERIAQFPTLSASVGLEAPTLWDCALLVIATSEVWADLSHFIERTRLLGKKSISDASDAATARAAYEAIAWPV